MKVLGFPEKDPVPEMDSTLKEPTERATDPAELKLLASNLTLVKDQEADADRMKEPVPLIGTPETVKRLPEWNTPLMFTIGDLGVGAPETICNGAFWVKLALAPIWKELPPVRVNKALLRTDPPREAITVVLSSVIWTTPSRKT